VHKKQANTPIPAKQAQPQPARNTVFKENKFRPAADKTKEKGKCWYCPEDWSFGHKCSGIKSTVHAIEMQGHSDDELEIPAQQAPLGPCLAQMAPPILPAPEQAAQEAPGPAHQLMLLSVEALHGIPGEGTLAIKITIENKQVVALIDSGNTNTFLDKSFAISHKLNLTPVSQKKVLVAGGGELISDAILPNCSYSLAGKSFSTNFHVLPLKGYDIIQGANWLKKYSPNFLDWDNRTISIFHEGEWLTLADHQSRGKDCIISAKACSKLLAQGADAFVLQLNL
jgi:hypothetical protein